MEAVEAVVEIGGEVDVEGGETPGVLVASTGECAVVEEAVIEVTLVGVGLGDVVASPFEVDCVDWANAPKSNPCALATNLKEPRET